MQISRQELGERLAEGGCAEIYALGEDSVLKLFKPNTNRYAVEREYANSTAVAGCGLPVRRVYEMVEVEERPGIVFERIRGTNLMDMWMSGLAVSSSDGEEDEGSLEGALLTAELLHQVHRLTLPGFPAQRESLHWDIDRAEGLTPAEKANVHARLDALPLKQCLCHGDPNPGNFLLRSDGPVIIDWMNASTGNPEADLAEYVIMIRFAVLPEGTPEVAVRGLDAAREAICAAFLNRYAELCGLDPAEVEPWLVPIAARKLSADAISEQEKAKLMAYIRAELARDAEE